MEKDGIVEQNLYPTVREQIQAAIERLQAIESMTENLPFDPAGMDEVRAAIVEAHDVTNAMLISVDIKADGIKSQTDKLSGQDPIIGLRTTNWNTGSGTSGEAGADLVTIGAIDAKNKVLSLLIGINALTAGALVTVKMFMMLNAVERKVYSQQFLAGTDPDGCWIIQAPVGIHEALRVEVYSSVNESKAINYDYMLEAM